MVKAVDIARELGISKATVSLALNGRPGVSEKTRQDIFSCRDRMEAAQSAITKEPEKRRRAKGKRIIKILVAIKGLEIALDTELDLWSDVLSVFCREAGRRGYEITVSYVDIRKSKVSEVVEQCNEEELSGVILHATELEGEMVAAFEEIRHPMVIFDNESCLSQHDCVVADNYTGVRNAVKYLLDRGHKEIVYLKNDKNIYSFEKRRNGFIDELLAHNMNPYADNCMVSTGDKIDNVYFNMSHYLDGHNLPEAFIMENYQVSIGVIRALKEKNIAVPGDVSLVGVDVIPDYVTGGCRLTTIRIPHAERARLTVILLDKEIEERSGTKSRVMTNCVLIEGESVKLNRENKKV